MATAIENPATQNVAAPPQVGAVAGAPAADVPYLLSSDEFFRMIEAEIFDPDRRIYLWDGRIYEAMAKTVPHSVSTVNVLVAVMRVLPAGWSPWPENPIAIAEDRAPLPDFTVVRGSANDYGRQGRHPDASDVGLIVEVAKSSVRIDTGAKLEAYAKALVPTYWVVNLVVRKVVVCTEPRVEGGVENYGSVKAYDEGESFPLTLDGREVAQIHVNDLLDAKPEPRA